MLSFVCVKLGWGKWVWLRWVGLGYFRIGLG
jgi:hypothetical protein